MVTQPKRKAPLKVIPPDLDKRTIIIETEFTVVAHDWNAELLEWHKSDICNDPLDPKWLSAWPQIRDNPALLEQFLNRAMLNEITGIHHWWPELTRIPATPSWQEIASQIEWGPVGICDVNDVMDSLSYCVIVAYDRATLCTPEETKTVLLSTIEGLTFERPELPATASVIAKKTGCITVKLGHILKDAPQISHVGLYQPDLWSAVHSTPEVLNALRTEYVLLRVYDDWAMDDGIFSRIARAFLPPDEDIDEHFSYRQLLPAICKLSPEDQQLYADYDAGKFEEGFGLPASVIFRYMGAPSVEMISLTVSDLQQPQAKV